MTSSLPTVLKGVAFENRSLQVLRHNLSMSLHRVGGKGDGGIDLQGWWWLPSGFVLQSSIIRAGAEARTPVRVYAQCKTESQKIGPRYIREFEGAILRYSTLATDPLPAGVEQLARHLLVGVFLSTSPFTKASLLHAFSSPIPLALMHLPEHDGSLAHSSSTNVDATAGDFSGSLVFNPALGGASGLLRGSIEARWERSSHILDWRPGIWCDGRRVESWVPTDSDPLQSNV